MDMTRRGFIGSAAVAACGFAGRCAIAADAKGAGANGDGTIWAGLFHMGVNMWSDQPVDSWGPYKGEQLKLVCKSNRLRFDEKVWRSITGRMADVGMNMIVIDLGEAIKYPSHPELWVDGSWEIDRFRKELDRLRAMGLEPIPKMNFSTAHDTWLNTYERMVSTKKYYQVCADLIRDVAEIFDHPRFLHLGYDEETAGHQKKYAYCVVRQDDLWWHDFLWFVKETEKNGMRPWIWSDYVWHHPDLFYKRMPKSVLQSNWYYGGEFDVAKLGGSAANRVKAYEDLDKAGFDQVPTGSNWSSDVNFSGTVAHCRRVCSPERLKGFLMAPWFFTLPEWEAKNIAAVDQVGACIRKQSL